MFLILNFKVSFASELIVLFGKNKGGGGVNEGG